MRIVLGSVAWFATQVALAATPIDGWYASVFGGYAYVPNNLSTNYGGLYRSQARYQAGFDAGGSLGFKSNPMRYEGEISYIDAQLKHFNIAGIPQTGVKGYNHVVLAMANVFYDVQLHNSPIQPFLGLGIGYGWIDAVIRSTGPAGLTAHTGSNSDFAYQGAAGLTFQFSENYALNIGYRYVATVRDNTLGHFFQTQLFNVGAIYRFDGNNYK